MAQAGSRHCGGLAAVPGDAVAVFVGKKRFERPSSGGREFRQANQGQAGGPEVTVATLWHSMATEMCAHTGQASAEDRR